jgi:hypothetical protein
MPRSRPRFRSRIVNRSASKGSYGLSKSKCIGIGLAFGLIVGAASRNYGLGILIGGAIGGLIWFVQQRRQSGGQP